MDWQSTTHMFSGIAGRLYGLLKELRNQPHTYFAIGLILVTFVLLEHLLFIVGWYDRFELFGMAATLWGVIWTAFGVILPHNHWVEVTRIRTGQQNYFAAYRSRLHPLNPPPTDSFAELLGEAPKKLNLENDLAELAGAIIKASTFGKVGLLLVALGSVALAVKPVHEAYLKKIEQQSSNEHAGNNPQQQN